MNQVKIIYGTAWSVLGHSQIELVLKTLHRKKQRTTDLVVQAVLNGFRAIDTGMFKDMRGSRPVLIPSNCPACQPKHYRFFDAECCLPMGAKRDAEKTWSAKL
jgi:hypothetical protein